MRRALCEGGSDHCPAMKGIEIERIEEARDGSITGSDHCPAMKGIENGGPQRGPRRAAQGSDHCPAMKGIENESLLVDAMGGFGEATTAPQ